jgi:hypothetical protein
MEKTLSRAWMRNTIFDQISALRIVSIYKIFIVVITIYESFEYL